MKTYRRLLIISILISALLLPQPALAQTSIWTDIQSQVGVVCVSQGDVATLQGVGCLFYNLLSVALRVVGLAMFIMLLVGGFQYLSSGGDPKALEAAKGTITAAIVGLTLAILAWFILVLIQQVTGLSGNVDLTKFTPDIPQ